MKYLLLVTCMVMVSVHTAHALTFQEFLSQQNPPLTLVEYSKKQESERKTMLQAFYAARDAATTQANQDDTRLQELQQQAEDDKSFASKHYLSIYEDCAKAKDEGGIFRWFRPSCWGIWGKEGDLFDFTDETSHSSITNYAKNTVPDLLMRTLVIVATLGALWNGGRLIKDGFTGGDPTNARKGLGYAFGGLVMGIFAWYSVATVMRILTGLG